MSKEGRQMLTTLGIATLVAVLLVGLAWVSMADLVFVVLAGVLGLGVGWTLGARHVAAQARQASRTRRRAAQPRTRSEQESKTMKQGVRVRGRPTRRLQATKGRLP